MSDLYRSNVFIRDSSVSTCFAFNPPKPTVFGGRPFIPGMRIAVSDVLGWLAKHISPHALLSAPRTQIMNVTDKYLSNGLLV